MADRQIRAAEALTTDEEFRRIFDAHFGRVFHFFLYRGCPREEAQDLAQETFLRVYRGLPRFRGEASTELWLFQIAANLWTSHVRRMKAAKRERLEVSLQTELGEDLLAVDRVLMEEGLEDRLLEEERSRLLRTALAELPPRMRQCVLLRFEGVKYREIAVVLQCSIDTVKSLLYQARRRLHAELGKSFPDLET